MPAPDELRRIDDFQARRLGVSFDALHTAGVRVVAHGGEFADYRGVYALAFTEGCIITTPPALRDEYDAARRGSTPQDVIDSPLLEKVAGARPDRVIGPAALAYAGAADFRPAPGADTARLLTDDDMPLFDALRGAVDPAEWADPGIDPALGPVFASFAGDAIAAIAQYTVRGPLAHIGVLTHPVHRRRGHAAAVASAAILDALNHGLVPQWQALEANAGSLALARRLGFVRRYRSLAVRLRDR